MRSSGGSANVDIRGESRNAFVKAGLIQHYIIETLSMLPTTCIQEIYAQLCQERCCATASAPGDRFTGVPAEGVPHVWLVCKQIQATRLN